MSIALIAGVSVAMGSCGRDKSASLGERVIPFGKPVPKGGGRYQVGQPYEIAGVRYVPREDPRYDRTGQASWYGELFHGRYTANGEIYDMDRLSAAHPTLPLPVYVHVTNLENGRSLVVRVNDRGPFKKGRIIDLSRRSAEILGFKSRGTAPVRVRYMRRAPLSGDDSYERRFLANSGYGRFASGAEDATPPSTKGPTATLEVAGMAPPMPDRRPPTIASLLASAAQSSPEPPATDSLRIAARADPEPTGSLGPSRALQPNRLAPPGTHTVQAASFRMRGNAERAERVLSAFGHVDLAEIDVGGETFFRVRVGPFADGIAAAEALSRIRDAGYVGARLVEIR